MQSKGETVQAVGDDRCAPPSYMFSPRGCGDNEVSHRTLSGEGFFSLCWFHFNLEKSIEQIVLPQERAWLGPQTTKHTSFQQTAAAYAKTLCAEREKESKGSKGSRWGDMSGWKQSSEGS